MAKYLLDTNLLLRLVLPHDPMLPIAQGAISTLLGRGDSVFVTAQNLIEFWAVTTRPPGSPTNGLGLSIPEARAELDRIKRVFAFLPDNDQIILEWEKLAVSPGCDGKHAHDGRLVAVMLAHGVPNLLTFNGKDYLRYRSITVVHPGGP